MPIEFPCTACFRTLRVPDGTAGKSCNCPGCQTRLLIPSPNEVLASDEALSVRIDVPCPNCGKTLECDASLDGTRGCCPSCAYVFTIRLDQDPNEIIAEIQSFPFACPKCKQLFEGTPDKLGRKGKCTNCGDVFVIERYQPPKSEPEPTKVVASANSGMPTKSKAPEAKLTDAATSNPKKPIPTPKKPAAKSKPVAAESNYPDMANALGDLSLDLPPADITFKPAAYVPPTTTVRPTSKPHSKSGGSSASAIKVILITLGCLAGTGVFALCAGLFTLVLYAQSSKTITAGDYSAVAPGIRSNQPVPKEASSGGAIGNPNTHSEYVIVLFRVDPLKPLLADKYILGLTLAGAIDEGSAVRVSRAGLTGYRYSSRRSGSFPGHTGEVFDTPDGMLALMYVTAEQAGKTGRLRKNLTPEQIRSYDNPDAFFESLSKNE